MTAHDMHKNSKQHTPKSIMPTLNLPTFSCQLLFPNYSKIVI